jgi:beta-glucosidase
MADISLQDSQKKLLAELKKTGKPIVMVLFNGRPMTLKWESENMDAILDAWFGGIEAGNAVADVLFGQYNPSGKLSTSFPVHVGQVPVYHSMLNTGRPYNHEEFSKFKSNYLDIPNEPLYPFGFGLSYTNYAYGPVTLSGSQVTSGKTINATVTVTNTGKVDGLETVQLYIRDVVGSIARPLKELKGFKQVQLRAGESKQVSFTISSDDLKFYNSNLQLVNEPGDYKVFIGGNSRDLQGADFKWLAR